MNRTTATKTTPVIQKVMMMRVVDVAPVRRDRRPPPRAQQVERHRTDGNRTRMIATAIAACFSTGRRPMRRRRSEGKDRSRKARLYDLQRPRARAPHMAPDRAAMLSAPAKVGRERRDELSVAGPADAPRISLRGREGRPPAALEIPCRSDGGLGAAGFEARKSLGSRARSGAGNRGMLSTAAGL